MARHVDLRDLIPEDDERDTITMPDGKTFLMPKLGVKEMGRLLMLEGEVGGADTFEALGESNDKIVAMLKRENPKKKIPDDDLTVEQLMSVIAAFAGADSVAAAVREAIAGDAEESGETTDEDAQQTAADLGEAAGTRSEGEDRPLVSKTPSRKRSSRSGTSGSGGRSGGKKRRGGSSKRTSAKLAPSSAAG